MLKENTQAPDFRLVDQDGLERSVAQEKGKWLVLYFYPKDDTPGCITEAKAFRDSFNKLSKLGVSVMGISSDSETSHRRFAAKYGINFPILSDVDREAIKNYEANGLFGAKRVSYLISPDGMVYRSYDKVNPDNHVDQVVRDLEMASIA